MRGIVDDQGILSGDPELAHRVRERLGIGKHVGIWRIALDSIEIEEPRAGDPLLEKFYVAVACIVGKVPFRGEGNNLRAAWGVANGCQELGGADDIGGETAGRHGGVEAKERAGKGRRSMENPWERHEGHVGWVVVSLLGWSVETVVVASLLVFHRTLHGVTAKSGSIGDDHSTSLLVNRCHVREWSQGKSAVPQPQFKLNPTTRIEQT